MSRFNIVYEVAVRRGYELLIDTVHLDLIVGKDINEMLEEYYEMTEWDIIKVTSIKIEKKCFGCRNDRPGQHEHMDEDGCLYQGGYIADDSDNIFNDEGSAEL